MKNIPVEDCIKCCTQQNNRPTNAFTKDEITQHVLSNYLSHTIKCECDDSRKG